MNRRREENGCHQHNRASHLKCTSATELVGDPALSNASECPACKEYAIKS